MLATEKELQVATKTKHVTTGRGAMPRQDYLRKVIEEIEKLSDEAWNGLTAGAQAWVNAAAIAYKANEDIPEFPEDAAPTARPAATTKAPKAAAAQPASEAETPASNGPAPAPTVTAGTAKKSGSLVAIKQMMIEDPQISTQDLQEKLAGLGFAPSALTVSSIRSDFRHSLKMLHGAGKLQGVNVA